MHAHDRGAERALGFAPCGVVRGTVLVPGSKSIAQRALVVSALTAGTTRVSGLPDGADVRAALALVSTAGARVTQLAPAAVAIEGRPPGPHRGWRAESALDAGESGTLARLATASFALCGLAARAGSIGVRGTLARRKSGALFAALRAAGVRTDPADASGWPVSVTPIGPPSEVVLVDPSSSQEASALLVALAAYPGEHALRVRGAIPSRPYLALTIATLARFGVVIESEQSGNDEIFRVRGPLSAPENPIAVEPDASAAAVALAAGCLSGGDVLVPGLDARSAQGDVRSVEHLRAFGCDASITNAGLRAHGRPLHGADLDLSGEPDLAPVLAAVAAAAALERGATSRLFGLGTLQGKESARIDVLASGLARLGLAIESGPAHLSIAPGSRPSDGAPVELDTRADHRMAFAFALVGLARANVLVRDPGCVAKSWPGFWSALEKAGAIVVRGG